MYAWPPSPPHQAHQAHAHAPLPREATPPPHDEHAHAHALLVPPLSPCFSLALPPLYDDAPLSPPPQHAFTSPAFAAPQAAPENALVAALRFPDDDPLSDPSAWPPYVPSPECAGALAYYATFRTLVAASAPCWNDATVTRVLDSRWQLLNGRDKLHYARLAHAATVRRRNACVCCVACVACVRAARVW
jgi:hypothetical protein